MGKRGDTEAIYELFLPACDRLGVELFDVERRAATLLVTIERADGLDLDTVAAVSRELSEVLDAHDTLAPPGKYELEVSSPGVERRLRRPEHFAAAIGKPIAVRTVSGTSGERRFEAVLLAADESGVRLHALEGERELAYEAIDRAHTVFDWRAALSRGRGSIDEVPDAEPGEAARAVGGSRAAVRERASQS